MCEDQCAVKWRDGHHSLCLLFLKSLLKVVKQITVNDFQHSLLNSENARNVSIVGYEGYNSFIFPYMRG